MPSDLAPQPPTVLFSAEAIDRTLSNMAQAIDSRLELTPYIMIVLLEGARYMAKTLCEKLQSKPEIRYIRASSYKGTSSTGTIRWEGGWGIMTPETPVLIVDDVLDTGNTLFAVREKLVALGAHTILTAVTVDKPCKRQKNITPDYAGFTTEDHFIVGFGMDLDGQYRDLPYIGILS